MQRHNHQFTFTDPVGSVNIECTPCINFAMHHNHYPVLLSCTLTNDSDADWANVDVSLSGEMFVTRSAHIDGVVAGASLDLSRQLSIDVDPTLLIRLSEGVTASCVVAVSIDGVQCLCESFPLQLLPFDQWPGMGVRPELLAAFVTPNHPLLPRISVNAAAFLEKWTGSGALDEYQSQDPNRVRAQVAAVYEALRSEAIVYATPPANYESDGQRIRTADRVLTEKLGTCIDLTLLMASCLESLGINPLIILMRGHCFLGAWLVRDTYPKPVGDDASFLVKSAAEGIAEIVVVETTHITGSGTPDFESAVDDAMAHLRDDKDFIAFIDVYRARVGGVRPLPLRVKDGDDWIVETSGLHHDNATTAVRHVDRYDLTEYSTDGKEVSKFTIWERKLLDFSLRNNLLNIRPGRRVIPLVSFALPEFENELRQNVSFRIEPFPLNDKPVAGAGGIFNSALLPQLADYAAKQLANHRVNSFLDADALKEAMKYLYRASRTSLEENGANNLYLVIGMLKWYETERSQQPRFAPILLIPVEMVRAAGGAGYTVRARDEETVLNITLAQLLKQQHGVDITMLEDLPKDESGIDVQRVLALVRDRIRSKHSWDVLDEAMVGLFSFSKFVMWNDIHSNSAALLDNDIISSLTEGRLMVADDADIDARDADREMTPDSILLPIDVDSSQLEAVLASGSGHSFILHGPPGTGKSQTITNMIANALYQGKRVLFVAEKMAALEVVQTRLQKIGLSPFCLELHSNKATKQHFLKQMDDALSVTRTASPESFAADAEALYQQRQQLISYIEALHSPGVAGISLYDSIMAYCAIPGEAVEVDLADFPGLTRRGLEALTEQIGDVDAVLRLSGRPDSHPLRDLDITDGSAAAEEALRSLSLDFIDVLRRGCHYIPAVAGVDSREGLDWAARYLRLLQSIPCFSAAMLPVCVDPVMAPRVEKAVRCGARAAEKRARIAGRYTSGALALDAATLDAQWRAANDKWAVARFFARRSMLKRMEVYMRGFSDADMECLIADLRDIESDDAVYEGSRAAVAAVMPELAYQGSEDWGAMLDCLKSIPELRREVSVFAALTGVSTADAARCLAECAPANMLTFVNRDRPMVDAYVKSIEGLFAATAAVSAIAVLPPVTDAYTDTVTEALGRWRANAGKFRDWFRWCDMRRRLVGQRLGAAVECIVTRGLSGAESAKAFAKGYYHALATRLINDNDNLRFFNGLLLDDTIRKYRELTARYQQLSKQELYCRLASLIPSQQMAACDSSEIGILKRNIRNGGRGASIRRIIDQIPTLLPRLCPCMLMSPLSVAQYYDLKNERFDLVIFDEASQMPTSEAVGAIARGKALVVVGDPKQMPPTSFFTTSNVGEDEAWVDDLESILDDCISLSIPSRHLRWHYRSRHESLISFSNAQYYGGNLFTFPSVDDRVSKVSVRYVGGVYDKGRSRSNIMEAQAVVDEVLRRLADPELSRLSIGIVSFSKVQQDKIEDILTEALAANPALEALAYDTAEPIFVKNLENVQGDERDVILFSVGYGPDKDGRVSMNFGPLNNAGGERRLNVAVSRARYEMVVFSSLHPEQIDLRRSSALGVEGLKRFLEFAENGRSPIPADQASAPAENYIVARLAGILEDYGYRTARNVGSSKFRIDLAVLHPDRPDEFILGILCDGANYYETKTVRDREIVQPAVLGQLNWHIMRLWTLDWFERPDAQVQAIIDRIECLRKGVAEADPSLEPAVDEQPFKEAAPVAPSVAPPVSSYEFARLDYSSPLPGADALANHIKTLRRQLMAIIEVEQPITTGLLYKRVVKQWGISRVSPRVQGIVDSVLADMTVYATDNGGNGRVLWTDADAAAAYTGYRTESERDISDMPLVEVENAMLFTIRQQVALDADDLKRLTAQQLGFTRKGTNIENVTTAALNNLEKRGVLVVEGVRVKSE